VFGVLGNRRVQIGVLIVGALLAVALWPETTPVDAAAAERGRIVVTVDEEGQTRVRDRYVVSAPVAGRVLRIELEPGDPVKEGDVVARVRPEMPALLDPRTRAEAQAALDSARAVLGRARADEQRARTTQKRTESDLERTKQLRAAGLATAQELDLAQADAAAAAEAARAAAYAVRAATADVERAQARLRTPAASNSSSTRAVEVRAPAGGVILRRLRESESVVPGGEPLLEIGDPNELEIVSDLLSTDAVRVKPGARAIIDQWGGGRTLDAKVRLVEPSGFTKISALGVEEQRVNVILDFVDPAGAWAALGDGYRVEVRVVVAERPDALKVPTSALFRQGERWAVYVIENGRARVRELQIGLQTGVEAEVTQGLSQGERVIVHPGDTLSDGARVEERK
jgi:HlyD family secretion protein